MFKSVSLITIWMVVLPLYAQTEFRKEFNIGLSQGAALNWVGFDPPVSQQILVSYTGGLVFRYITEPNLGLQLEVNYLQRGWTEDPKKSGVYERKQEMVTIPVMTHIYFGKKSKIRLLFVVGPYIAFLLSDTEKNKVTDTIEYNDYYGKSLAGKFEYGLTGGLGGSFRTRVGIFELQARYSHSLTNLFKAGKEEFRYLGSRPQTVDICLRYVFNLSSRRQGKGEPQSVTGNW
ncbi:MAG: PorT family protein [Bacteroidales bacterium]|nr:PorT family protein [Bacteroidales bacterium]